MLNILWLILVVAAVIWLSVKKGIHPFLALLGGGISMGFLAGIDAETVLGSVAGGFGSTLKSIGIVIAAGAIIGEYLDKSGGAKVLANSILNKTGDKNAPLSLGITGYIVSIPVFCDSGFIVLSSLKDAIAKRTGLSAAALAIALSAGLYTTHVFVPPTPGPLAAAATLGADVGIILILGLIVSVPVMLAGLLWARLYCSRFTIEYKVDQTGKNGKPEESEPSFIAALAPILLPILLIAMKSIAELPGNPFGEGAVQKVFIFAGDPITALLTGVLFAFIMASGIGVENRRKWIEGGLTKAGTIILITGAGGAFGEVLRSTELSEFAGNFAAAGALGIAIPFIISAFLKTAQGSSTVAIITASAITLPLLGSFGLDSETGKALAVLSIGAGAMTVSHVNDSYFWVVAKFSNMDTSTALRTHTIATLIMGITGLISVQILAWVLL